MADKKNPNNQQPKQTEKKPLNESQRTFSEGKAKNHEKFYISKPKITSQTGNNDNDKKK